MIKITIDLLPFGDASRKRTIASMDIWNTGDGTAQSGNYRFRISKQGKLSPLGIWKEGSLENFPRKQKNVWHLIMMCLVSALHKSKI